MNIPGTAVDVEDVIAEIERAAPEVAGRITCEGPSLPFPGALDSSEFARCVGELELTPLGRGVAETIEHFRATAS